MGDTTLIGLGFQGNNNNRFQSTNPNLAPGGVAFFACTLVQVKESLLSSPTQCTYFGNYGANRGWDIGRAADTAASDPPNTPEFVTFRARIGTGGATTTLTYTCDASSIFGRTFLLGLSLVGGVATLYVNAAAVASETLGGPMALGNVGLAYGNVAGGGQRSGDPVIAAVFTDTDAADFLTEQRDLFDLVRGNGKLNASVTSLGLVAEYGYESFQQKAPTSGVPTTPLKNFGSAGVNGDLTFIGTAALVVNADPDPDYTGGAQSPSVGPGAVNLQDAYDSGPTGLIVTDVGIGPFGVDDVRIENSLINNGVASGNLTVQAGGGTGAGDGGTASVIGGHAAGSGAAGDVVISGGTPTTGPGNGVTIQGTTGGVSGTQGQQAGSIGILAGAGGASAAPDNGATGGQVIVQAGTGGNGTGGGTQPGNGGELNLSAGTAGTAAGGAGPATGGDAILSAGTGGATGIGGATSVRSGNGVQSGDLDVVGGSCTGGIAGTVRVTGSPTTGIGSGPGGNVEINGGESAVGEAQDGGAVFVTGGTGDGAPAVGGRIDITGGTTRGGGGPGGEVHIRGGAGGGGGLDTGGAGGNVTIEGGLAGQPNQPGGNLVLAGGQAGGAGSVGGDVTVASGSVIGASTGSGDVVIQSGQGTGVGSTAGSVQLGLNGVVGTEAANAGGFYVNPANGRLSFRTFTPAATATGAVRLPNINNAGEALQTADDGVMHYCTQQAVGVATTVGFRLAKSGDFALASRCYERTFVTADAPSDELDVTHNLDSSAVQYAVYDPTGVKQFETPTQIAGMQLLSDDAIRITFNSGLITAGTWRVIVFGY
jgi:hypothetical protein